MYLRAWKHELDKFIPDGVEAKPLFEVGEKMNIFYHYIVPEKIEHGVVFHRYHDKAKVEVIEHIYNALIIPASINAVLKTEDEKFIERRGCDVFSMSELELVGCIAREERE